MSFSAEQPTSCSLEVCCICKEEFRTDSELANHLLSHTEDNSFTSDIGITIEGTETTNILPPSPARPSNLKGHVVFPEYTKTSFVKGQGLRKSFTRRSRSPEVWEILSDDSEEDKPKAGPATPNIMRNNFRQVGQGQGFSNNQPRLFPQMEPPYNCRVCSSVFNDPKLFRDHLLTHEKPRPYSCHICNKTFAYKGTLRQHLHLHIGEKLHECATCHKRFTIKSVLRKHLEMHEMQKNRLRPT